MDLPQRCRRIWIVGPTGSGKSTLARKLGAELSIPVWHLDEIYHLPGWKSIRPPEFLSRVDSITSDSEWIVDGNYGTVRQPFMPRADLIIWLDLPLRMTLPRLLFRSLRRIIRRQPCCNGNYETFRQTFFSRQSILWWAISTDGRRLRFLEAETKNRPHLRVRSSAELKRRLPMLIANCRADATIEQQVTG